MEPPKAQPRTHTDTYSSNLMGNLCLCTQPWMHSFCFESAPANPEAELFRTNSFHFILLCSARPDHPALLSGFISVRGGGPRDSFPQPCRATDLHRDRRQSGYSLWLLGLMNSLLHHIMHNMHLLDFFFRSGGGETAFPLAFLSVKCGR